jgi:tetratricopeptide (TPR) repeat protein
LKKADLDPMTPLFAMQNYYAFAENELALAGGHQPAASLALYGWARLQALLGGTTPGGAQPAKAVALHRAALKIDPRNYLAANELAVLMARYGESEEARQLLLHSLSLTQRSETLHNLAVVCETLGRREEAAAARKHCQEAMSAERADPQTQGTLGGMVYWVDRQTFSQHADPSELGNAPSGSARSAQAQQPAPPKNQSSDPLASLVLNAWKRLTGASVENKPAAPPSISVN